MALPEEVAKPIHREAGEKTAQQEGATKGVVIEPAPPRQRAQHVYADVGSPADKLQGPEAQKPQIGISFFQWV